MHISVSSAADLQGLQDMSPTPVKTLVETYLAKIPKDVCPQNGTETVPATLPALSNSSPMPVDARAKPYLAMIPKGLHPQNGTETIPATLPAPSNSSPTPVNAPAYPHFAMILEDLRRLNRTEPVPAALHSQSVPTGYGSAYSQTPVQVPIPTIVRPTLSCSPVEVLTACMQSAPCPKTAQRIYRVLYSLALEVIRVRGLPVRPTIAEFHLPLDLLAAHLEVDRTTIWRNLEPLVACGVLAAADHFGTLDKRTAVTGKIWAVALDPAKVLAGTANKARVSLDALKFPWRDLDRDRREGRTAYNLTRTNDQQAAAKTRRKEQAEQIATSQERARERKAERASAKLRGEKVPVGRAAATVNAAKTRAEKSVHDKPKGTVQQSLKTPTRVVDRDELYRWALTPFVNVESVTLTVALGSVNALDTVYTLPSLAGLSKRARGAAVENSAKALASEFNDTANVRFWCWLLWQMLRAADQGQNWATHLSQILARVLHDLKHDDSMDKRTARRQAALVVAALQEAGLLDALKQITPTRVGVRPEIRAA